jgi:hypothetical protein
MMGSRGGRPLKSLPRTPSGQLSRSSARRAEEAHQQRADYRASVETRARKTGLSARSAISPLAGRPEGPLVHLGVLTAAMAEAIDTYRDLRRRYSKSVPGPRPYGSPLGRMVKSSLEGMVSASVMSDVEWSEEERDIRDRRRYETAEAALSLAGQEAVDALHRFADRSYVSSAQLLHLRTAASRLCSHLGLRGD